MSHEMPWDIKGKLLPMENISPRFLAHMGFVGPWELLAHGNYCWPTGIVGPWGWQSHVVFHGGHAFYWNSRPVGKAGDQSPMCPTCVPLTIFLRTRDR